LKRTKKGVDPPALARFRSAEPDATWDEFRLVQGGYDDVRSALATDQGHVCAYCEIRLPVGDSLRFRVEHVHSKSAGNVNGVNVALQWENLLGVCTGGTQTAAGEPYHRGPLPENWSCDAHKQHLESKGQLPVPCTEVVLHPLELPAHPNVFRYEYSTGALLPDPDACAQAGLPVERVASTIRVFNLNCDRLCEARKVVAYDLERRKKSLRTKGIPARAALQTIARQALGTRWPQFFTTIRWSLRPAFDEVLVAIAFDG
jgi:uncharacterized protein (TIGR02646 family)